jgi:thiamine transporter 2/3
VADLYGLNWSSFIGVCGALFISFLLPWTKHSEIFHRVSYSISKGPTPSDNAEMETDVSDLNDSGYQDYMEKDNLMISGDKLHHSSNEPGYRYKLLYMWTGLKYVYRNEGVFVWSIWWALATCGNFRIYYYVQNYWGSIISDNTECHDLIYNGAVEAISSLFGK